MSHRIGRRQLLGALGAGLGASTLPFVPWLDARAAGAPPPKRILFFFSSNGTVHESWVPEARGERLHRLSPILAPLERHRARLLVIDGLAHKVIIEKSSRSGHTAGMNTALTGRNNEITDPRQPLHSLATGVSLDQHLGARLGANSKLRTVEAGVQVEPYNKDFAALSYAGRRAPILPESSPYRLFDRLFTGASRQVAPSGDAADVGALEDRRLVLEAVSADLDALRARLPASDRVKVEAHLDAVRALGHSLATGVGAGASAACAAPTLARHVHPWNNDDIPALARLQTELVVMSLACDLTRVATLQFGRGGAAHRFTWLGQEFARDPQVGPACQAKGLHALAHRDTDPVSRAKLVRIHAWYAAELAHLLDRLASVREGGGTLLDSTVVVWMNELGTGGDHSHERTPWVLIGGSRQQLSAGRLLTFPGEPHNRLLLSLCHMMGVEAETFGDPDYCARGPLTGLA
ncbi:MAG: DUF1552 domain-containing protein [Polyangiaceae bacterium]|nr:DUF1552 domain-containing protein [Polyangiaceae bacterium]